MTWSKKSRASPANASKSDDAETDAASPTIETSTSTLGVHGERITPSPVSHPSIFRTADYNQTDGWSSSVKLPVKGSAHNRRLERRVTERPQLYPAKRRDVGA